MKVDLLLDKDSNVDIDTCTACNLTKEGDDLEFFDERTCSHKIHRICLNELSIKTNHVVCI